MVQVHINSVQEFPRWHSHRVEMTVNGPPGGDITAELANTILQATIPAGIDNPNIVVQVSVYPPNGPAFYFERYKTGPLLVGDLENDLVLDGQMNLFQHSGQGFEFTEGTNIVVSFYDIPDVEELRRAREAVNLNVY